MTEYERLTAFTRLLQDVAEMLRMKGRTLAADIIHDEAVHFALERDIARYAEDLADELSTAPPRDLGQLDGDDCRTDGLD